LVVFVVTRHEYYLSFIAVLPSWCNDNSISRYPVHWLLGRIREEEGNDRDNLCYWDQLIGNT